MIHKEQGELVAECEDCGISEYAGTLEFREFVEHLKDAGWKISKDGEEWIHRCQECSV